MKGLLFTVQKALPLFQDGGSIILTASAGGSKGIEVSVFTAQPKPVRSFARTWTVDLKHLKIRVNAISPGPIDTPIISGVVQTDEQVEQLKSIVASVPMGRMGSSDEVAKPPRSSRRMIVDMSPASNCSSMGVRHKSKPSELLYK